jgi:hypothetical protein
MSQTDTTETALAACLLSTPPLTVKTYQETEPMQNKIRRWFLNDFGSYLVKDWWAWGGILLGLLLARAI